MTLTFQNFESIIDPEILERGWQYFRSGHVRNLTQEGDGVWTARVKGTVTYDVVIEPGPDDDLECECTCPYEWGPYCKHVAAVLYAIQEQSGGVVQTTARPAKSPKQKSKDRLRAILEGLSREELIAILTQQFEKDRAFADRVLAQYSEEVPHKSVYARRVRESLKAGQGEYGYIDYWGASAAVKGIHEMLADADTLLASGSANKTIPMLQAIIEGLVSVIEEADDSNGEIGGAIEEAFQRLERAAELLPANEKRDLLSYCLTEAFREQYKDWDWKWDWLEVATRLAASAQDREAVFTALDRMAGRRSDAEFLGDFDAEQAAHIKLNMIERMDGPEKALEFMLRHQHLERMRQRLVQFYIDRGNLAEARKLCADALWQLEVRASRHLYRGVYEKFLLEIAEREGDTGEIVRLARDQFVSTGDFRYYDQLKKTVAPAHWPGFVEELIQTISKTRDDWHTATYFLPEIYAREGMWDKLLEMVKQEGARLLEPYRRQLEERYPDEVCAVYEKSVYKHLETSSSRKVYQQICQYLSRMKKPGKEARVNQIVAEIQAKYPKRRALMEELARV